MRGTADLHLLDTPVPDLLHEVTAIEPVASGVHVLFDQNARIRSTQRLALADVGGGIVAFTWPAELKPQALYLYDKGRGGRLLEAASDAGWEVDTRPHLAFRNSRPSQRLYMNPSIEVGRYVEGWAGSDGRKIGQHDPDEIRKGLWPWLLERGYASREDEQELEGFLARLGKRPAHLRPGLRLLRRWGSADVAALRGRSWLVDEIRDAINRVLLSVGDRPLPVRSPHVPVEE